MNKKGFTLVELLAVIIILSLLALLTSTAVTKLVKDAKNDLNSTQIELIKSAAQTWGADNLLGLPSAGECSYLTVKNLKDYGLLDSNLKNLNTNEKISDEVQIKISTTNNTNSNKLITTYEVNPTHESVEGCYQQIYNNGEEVYFNVLTGESCTEDDYREDNSITGYNGINNAGNQTNCLKFYAFLDNGSRTLNLLLDHNITDSVMWSNSETTTSTNGPIDVIDQLQKDTNEWQGTLTPKNYKNKTSNASYIIDYNGYKARLITAQEIAKITGADKSADLLWDESTSRDWYYFDTAKPSFSTSCTDNDENTKCIYGWLYDRTGLNCKTNGCLNNSDSSILGYWTGSSSMDSLSVAWLINNTGRIESLEVNTNNSIGIRPVIEVSKSKLQ